MQLYDAGRRTATLPGEMSRRRNSKVTSEAEALALAVHELLRRVRFDDVQSVCACGITRTECHVLEVVALDGPLSVNDIAARIRLNKSTASRAVESLTQKKLLRREDAEDARAWSVVATEQGIALWRDIVKGTAETYAAGTTAAERKTLIKLLKKIAVSS